VRKLHRARVERTTDNIPLAPSAMFVQTQKNLPPVLAALPIRPPTSPAPCMWRTGTPDARIAPRRIMISPARRSASTIVPQSHTARMSRPQSAERVPGSIPRATSSAQCNEKRRIESRDVIVRVT